ncbi:MAG TPA: hypothetical protein G4O02_06275 [Caldilineae bacterium]|nr:hypothetical protein [Caldilineae bacterium]
MMTSPTYISFLIRVWREGDPDHPEITGDWRAEVEHIQSGRRWQFDTLEDLARWLVDPLTAIEGESEPGGAER